MKYNFEDTPDIKPWNIYGLWIKSPKDIIYDLIRSYRVIKKYFKGKIAKSIMLFLRLLHITSYTIGWLWGFKLGTKNSLQTPEINCRPIFKVESDSSNPPIDLIIITIGRKILSKTLRMIDQLIIKPENLIIISCCNNRSNILKYWTKKSHDFNVILYRCEEGLPIWAARNLALNLSRNKYIAFLDDDCIPTRTWLEKLYESIRRKNNIVAVSGAVYPLTSNPVGKYFTFYRIHEPPRDLTHITLNNAILKKEAITAVGGFKPLPIWGGEDVDLSFRLLMAGYKLSYESRAIVYHYYPSSILYLVKKFFMYGKSIGYLAYRYGLEKPGLLNLEKKEIKIKTNQ